MRRKIKKCFTSGGFMAVVLAAFLALAAIPAEPAEASSGIAAFGSQDYIISNNMTLVPIRAVSEKLGAQVVWDGANQEVIVIKQDITLKLKVNNKSAYKTGKLIMLALPARLVNGRVFVPLRFVGQALGCEVKWYDSSRTVVILTPEGSAKLAKVQNVLESSTKNYSDLSSFKSEMVFNADLKITKAGLSEGVLLAGNGFMYYKKPLTMYAQINFDKVSGSLADDLGQAPNLRMYMNGKDMYVDSGEGWEQAGAIPPEARMLTLVQQAQQVEQMRQMLELAVISGAAIDCTEDSERYKINFSLDGKKMFAGILGQFLTGSNSMEVEGALKELEKLFQTCNLTYNIVVEKESMLPVKTAVHAFISIKDKLDVFELKMHVEGTLTEVNKEMSLPADLPKAAE
jgi:hypothetical protein